MAAKNKKERTELRNDQKNEQTHSQNQYQGFTDRQSSMAQAGYNQGGSRSGDLWNYYNALASTAGKNNSFDAAKAAVAANPSGSGGGGGGGGIKTPGGDYFSESEGYARNLAGTYGGVNEAFYKKMMDRGGLDDTAINNFRANGLFNEFQKTGGWSDADKANYRSRASSVLPGMYEGISNEMARRANAQGYGSGFTGAAAALARQQGQAMAEANINAELGLSDSVRSGRQWGAQAGSAAENALQSLISGNMLQTEGLAHSGRVSGAGLLTQIGSGRTQRDSSAAATAAANRATAAANERFRIQNEWDREQFGLTSAQKLFEFDMAQMNQADKNTLAGMSDRNTSNMGYYDARQTGLDKTPGWQDTTASIIGAGAGLAGGLIDLGGSKKKNPWL